MKRINNTTLEHFGEKDAPTPSVLPWTNTEPPTIHKVKVSPLCSYRGCILFSKLPKRLAIARRDCNDSPLAVRRMLLTPASYINTSGFAHMMPLSFCSRFLTSKKYIIKVHTKKVKIYFLKVGESLPPLISWLR